MFSKSSVEKDYRLNAAEPERALRNMSNLRGMSDLIGLSMVTILKAKLKTESCYRVQL